MGCPFRGLTDDELKVRFTDHTGELNARLPINVLEDVLGHSVSIFIFQCSPYVRFKYFVNHSFAFLLAEIRHNFVKF